MSKPSLFSGEICFFIVLATVAKEKGVFQGSSGAVQKAERRREKREERRPGSMQPTG